MSQTAIEYQTIMQRCRALFLKKHRDYGSAWRILRLPSITDQIFIKANRIRSIQEKGTQRVEDGIVGETPRVADRRTQIDIPHRRVGEFRQRFDVLFRPRSWSNVDGAETSNRVATDSSQRYAEIRSNAETADRRKVAEHGQCRYVFERKRGIGHQRVVAECRPL